MKLGKWLKFNKINLKLFAEMIGISRSQLHKYMYENAIPRYEPMIRIFCITEGYVSPNDFYQVHLIDRKKYLKEYFKDSFWFNYVLEEVTND